MTPGRWKEAGISESMVIDTSTAVNVIQFHSDPAFIRLRCRWNSAVSRQPNST